MREAKTRKYHSPEFKAKVGLEALRGVKTINEIGQEYGVHPVQVGQWKKEIQEQAKTLFEGKRWSLRTIFTMYRIAMRCANSTKTLRQSSLCTADCPQSPGPGDEERAAAAFVCAAVVLKIALQERSAHYEPTQIS
jgi:transposase-like protein